MRYLQVAIIWWKSRLTGVLASRARSPKPVLSSPWRPRRPAGRPEALVVTHFLDPTPTEIHVFSSLAAQVPIYVATTQNKHVWSVEGSKIRIVSDR